MTVQSQYLESTIKLAEYYKKLGDGCLSQIKPDEIHWSPNEASNSLAVIVKHLWGNMLSRWTNFLTEDGEKTWRDREAEFDNDIPDLTSLQEKWESGWSCFLGALKSLSEGDLIRTVYIRNEGCSVQDAIQRQMSHYPMHVGQMIYLVKMLRNDEWKSLSIPKGGSKSYNQEKFDKPQETRHFTDRV